MRSYKNHRLAGNVIRPLLLVVVFTITTALSSASLLSAQEDCEDNIEKGKQKYERGQFYQAIGWLQACLEEGNPSAAQKKEAYKYLAQSYLEIDSISEAKSAITKLLAIVPNYQSDPAQDSAPYTKLVEEVREEAALSSPTVPQPTPKVTEPTPVQTEEPIREEKKGGGKRWLIWGGVAVAGGVTAALLLSGGGDKDLPAPPSLPGN